jgi:hypothetical protein
MLHIVTSSPVLVLWELQQKFWKHFLLPQNFTSPITRLKSYTTKTKMQKHRAVKMKKHAI